MQFTDMDDVKRANRDAGQHWFDPATIKFFNSRYSSELVEGRWFWSSEKAPSEPRRYTVREVTADGHIHTVGEFQAYGTREAAQRAIRALQNAVTAEALSCDTEDCPAPVIYSDESDRHLCDNHLTDALERQGGAYAGSDN